MGKPNTYIQLRQAQQRIAQLEIDLYYSKGFTIQQCMDMAMITLHEEFGFGPLYIKRFEQHFRQVFKDFYSLCVADGADDEELVYTKAKVDEHLRAGYGESLIPFDERYDINRMYFRDRREDWSNETNSGVQIGHRKGDNHDC